MKQFIFTLFIIVSYFCLFFKVDALRANSCQPFSVYVDEGIMPVRIERQLLCNSRFELFSHGRPGELLIKGEWLGSQDIAAFLKQRITVVTKHINIYGCEFGKGLKGQEAISYLEKTLGVTVAASSNITGKDGDWVLEVGTAAAGIAITDYRYNLQCDSIKGTVTLTAPYKGLPIPMELILDYNGNGIKDLNDSVIATTVTRPDGSYSLYNRASYLDLFTGATVTGAAGSRVMSGRSDGEAFWPGGWLAVPDAALKIITTPPSGQTSLASNNTYVQLNGNSTPTSRQAIIRQAPLVEADGGETFYIFPGFWKFG